MSTDHTIVLISGDQTHEAHVPAHILAAASPVWAERFALASPPKPGTDTKSTEIGVSPLEVDAFIGCLTLFTPTPTMPTLLDKHGVVHGSSTAHLTLQRFTAALTLVHKYECSGIVKLIAHLIDAHFPKCSLDKTSKHPSRRRNGHQDDARDVKCISSWITQAHLEFIMRANELFASENTELLNDTCLELLAHALSSPHGVQWSTCTRFSNGYHFQHGSIKVVDQVETPSSPTSPPSTAGAAPGDAKDAAGGVETPNTVYRHSYDATTASMHMFLRPLVLDTSRLQQPIMMRLLNFLKPRNEIHIVTQITDKFEEPYESARSNHGDRPARPAPAYLEPGEVNGLV